MKAILFHKYGSPDVLEFREIEKPVITEEEVLVQVRAASVNPAEWYTMTGLYLMRPSSGLLAPKNPRLGVDFAGVVEAVGGAVTDYQPGDEVFGGRTGAFAEYVGVRQGVSPKPANLTFEQAAAVPTAGLTALQGLRDFGRIQPGQKVLINGASGGVGTFAVQIAKAFGAEVTGVCSTRNVDLVRSLRADHVIDYTREDFTRGERRYDLFFDVAGSRPWSECRRVLNPGAIFVIVGGPKGNRWIGPLSHLIKVRLAALGASQKVVFFIAKIDRADLASLCELIEDGKVTPIIDRQYKLGELPDAMRYLGEGHARGKVVITMENEPDAGG
jgi:NADPH:quinone reductase-like Zn-dependent oxidoreductase